VCTVEARQCAAGDTGSGPGTVVSLRRAVRPLEHSRVQGWADIRYDERCIRIFRLRGRMTATSTRRHALGRTAVSSLRMRYFSLCSIALVTHRVVEQAPGSGRFSRRPLLGADGFVFTRIDAAGSHGQDEHAGLAYSMERWTSFTSAAPRTTD